MSEEHKFKPMKKNVSAPPEKRFQTEKIKEDLAMHLQSKLVKQKSVRNTTNDKHGISLENVLEHHLQCECARIKEEKESDNSDDEGHDEAYHRRTKGRIVRFKRCCKIPEQGRPIDKYQINLAKLRIKQEVYPIADTPWSQMYPQTIGIGYCRRKKKEVNDEQKTEKYNFWYVFYQDQGHDKKCKNFNDEYGAREFYETLKGKKARMLYSNGVVEKDGDKMLTESMKKYADENNKYIVLRDACMVEHKIEHVLTKEIGRRFTIQLIEGVLKSQQPTKEHDEKTCELAKEQNKELSKFDLQIYHAKQMESHNVQYVRKGSKIKQDPLKAKGSAIQGFRTITLCTVFIFLMVSIISLPILLIYKNGTESKRNNILRQSKFGNFTLGNLGQNSMQCAYANFGGPLQNIELNLECPYGNITEILPHVGIGMNAFTLPIRDGCQVNETQFQNSECSSALDKEKIQHSFQTNCENKEECKIKLLTKDIIWKKAKMSQECKDIRSKVFLQYSCTIDDKENHQKWNQLSIIAGCVTLIGFAFIGFTSFIEKQLEMNVAKDNFNTVTAEDYTVNVDFSENSMFNKFYTDPKNREEIHTKYQGSAVLAFRQYLIREIPLKLAIHEFKHSEDAECSYEDFIEEIMNNNYWYVCYQDYEKMKQEKFKDEKGAREFYVTQKGKEARMLYFNAVVDEDGDKTLTDKMKEYASKNYHQKEHITKLMKNYEISDVQFSFNNHQLINFLFLRGIAIQNQDDDNREKIEKKINKNIFDNFGKTIEMSQILSAFITFESCRGQEYALETGKRGQHHIQFLGSQLRFQEANNPRDVYWEKLQITKNSINQVLRQTVYLIAMIAFVFIFGIGDLAQNALKQEIQFTSQNCDLLYKGGMSQKEKITLAGQEFIDQKYPNYTIYNTKPNLNTGDIFTDKNLFINKNATIMQVTPFLACYCQDHGDDWSLFTKDSKNVTFNTTDGQPHTEKLCETYRDAKLSIIGFRYGAIFLLILTAHKLRLVVEHTVLKLGTDNGASSGSYVIFTVFFCQIFNFAILLLTANANMKQQGIVFNFLPKPFSFNGQFTDFTTNFYAILGDTFVLVLCINVIFQIIFEVFILLIQKLRKKNDERGCYYNKKKEDDKETHGEKKEDDKETPDDLNNSFNSMTSSQLDNDKQENATEEKEECQGKKKEQQGDKFQTKCTSIQEYINLHGGHEFRRDWRFSQLMVLIYMAMMFGTAIPLLFIVSFVSCLIYYYEQILLIFKFYNVEQQSGQKGMRQNMQAIRYFKAAPLVLFSFGFWQLSNFQLLEYKQFPLKPIFRYGEPPVQDHTILKYWSFDIIKNSGPAFPLLLWFFIYLFYLLLSPSYDPLKSLFSKKVKHCKEGEHLQNYHKNLTIPCNNWSFKEYHDYDDKFGLKISHNSFKEYEEDKDKVDNKTYKVSGIHSYDILRNPFYAEKFQYISMYIHNHPEGVDRAKIHFNGDSNEANNECQSDLVRLALFLPFMSQDDQASFRFSREWWQKKKDEVSSIKKQKSLDYQQDYFENKKLNALEEQDQHKDTFIDLAKRSFYAKNDEDKKKD